MEREHIALVKLNGKVAAMTVYYDEEDGIIIPKCGYDTGFSRYSPGMMNTIEMIKRVPASKMPYKIDLSRGYHSYKVRYGGIRYHNYGIKMTL